MTVYVVGLSLAGASAALALVRSNFSVHVLEVLNDLAIREQFKIQQAGGLVDATEFDSVMLQDLQRAGIDVGTDPVESFPESEDGIEILQWSGRCISLSMGTPIIYAPNGQLDVRDHATSGNFRRGWGFGVSYSAWSDAQFFVGKDIAVIGNGDFAYEQACICRRRHSRLRL